MKLVIIHYHLRPGGIRRVIEQAVPHILRAFDGEIDSITLVSGEVPDRKWCGDFERACRGTPVELFVEHAFGYTSEQRPSPAKLRRRIQRALEQLFTLAKPGGALVWAHNLGLARNLVLTQELTHACEKHAIPLLAHHHDWWFDNRWQRWPEARRAGFHSLDAVAKVIFGSSRTRHLTINHADAAILKRRLHNRVDWLPNLIEPSPPPPRERVRFARKWLHGRLGRDAPVWLLPCRLLRRKNVAEALLLTRWLRPEAWLVTTGGVSSAGEQAYFRRLNNAAHNHHWRLRLGVLAGDETRKPSVGELLAASEAVLLTSIQEGFGLPYLEATAAPRPLIARSLPNIAPDLEKFGFHFPQYYEEIQVSTDLFNWPAEQARQQRLWRAWLNNLPGAARKLVAEPAIVAAARQPSAVAFSRLTLTAQLEVLAQPVVQSWKICATLNPFLKSWRTRAESGQLRVTDWPGKARRFLSGEPYGESFLGAYQAATRKAATGRVAAAACQRAFIRLKLKPGFLYPLLWSSDT